MSLQNAIPNELQQSGPLLNLLFDFTLVFKFPLKLLLSLLPLLHGVSIDILHDLVADFSNLLLLIVPCFLLALNLGVLGSLDLKLLLFTFFDSRLLLSLKIVSFCLLEDLAIALLTMEPATNTLLHTILLLSKLIGLVNWSVEEICDKVFGIFRAFVT